jgi:hypothetical protein
MQKPMKRSEATPKYLAVASLLLTMHFGWYHPKRTGIHNLALDFTHSHIWRMSESINNLSSPRRGETCSTSPPNYAAGSF